MKKELEKNYNPADIETRLYEKWQEKKYFHAEVDKDKKTVIDCDAAGKYYGTASYGTCPG